MSVNEEGVVILPKLKKIDYSKKKIRYKLKDNTRRRRMAIDDGVNMEKKKTGRNTKRAAIAKKGRFNILRIYRRNKKINECKKITSDMRYMDRKYKLGETNDICGKKPIRLRTKRNKRNINNNKIRNVTQKRNLLKKSKMKSIRKLKGGKKKSKKKKQFLYNPNDPSKSFDVYIDKNPNDTIPIKYTTIQDVGDTIKKLERLFKNKKYSHKRIWQVGMIMKVRLEAMNKYKKTRYPNAKDVYKRYALSKKYFNFLGERTKQKTFAERKKMVFKF